MRKVQNVVCIKDERQIETGEDERRGSLDCALRTPLLKSEGEETAPCFPSYSDWRKAFNGENSAEMYEFRLESGII